MFLFWTICGVGGFKPKTFWSLVQDLWQLNYAHVGIWKMFLINQKTFFQHSKSHTELLLEILGTQVFVIMFLVVLRYSFSFFVLILQRVFESTFVGRRSIIKERFSKKYRHPSLDSKLTLKRLNAVCFLLMKHFL